MRIFGVSSLSNFLINLGPVYEGNEQTVHYSEVGACSIRSYQQPKIAHFFLDGTNVSYWDSYDNISSDCTDGPNLLPARSSNNGQSHAL